MDIIRPSSFQSQSIWNLWVISFFQLFRQREFLSEAKVTANGAQHCWFFFQYFSQISYTCRFNCCYCMSKNTNPCKASYKASKIRRMLKIFEVYSSYTWVQFCNLWILIWSLNQRSAFGLEIIVTLLLSALLVSTSTVSCIESVKATVQLKKKKKLKPHQIKNI